jgi:RNA polymerase sigma-70 factor (ECF subfamily)
VDDFSALYREHALPLTAYFLRRTRDAQIAADLTAETFAAALEGADRFDPARGTPVGWLYGIARNQLSAFERRHRVEDRARRRLGMERLELTDAAIAKLEAAAEREATAVALAGAMAELPDDQRAAVTARVVHERGYAEIAAATGSTEPAVRQRVSRALARLRSKEDLR